MLIAWIVVGIFAILSITLLLGKGSFLIAGYNTSSKEEKEQYNEKKLCRAMGVMLLSLTITTILLITNKIMSSYYGIFVVISSIVVTIYINTKCKK
ncbi:Domain of uncharacterised function (DUF3784) [Clostridium tetani]|uniref:DUF3784 domain-containing protein n=1 Tax=Clostridium tetani TaxID=1513 RepID=UPI000E131834|nr:DUF3784 domain-containing protein [Clostridium tetani]WFN60792.1 DUF3784 domain-containing protein [Clostridium tetani]BDR72584.1 hypothetical protein K144316041_12920 [Clostridium tetani]BDR83906.1 hypothetical protein K254310026_13170 [Clostridium tetani]SUY55749.1 Domain of uncharacterised function (DUF3784) [Clostridium tetani]